MLAFDSFLWKYIALMKIIIDTDLQLQYDWIIDDLVAVTSRLLMLIFCLILFCFYLFLQIVSSLDKYSMEQGYLVLLMQWLMIFNGIKKK
jgi:hypothetical protein